MAPNRNSATACLLVLLACVLALSAPSSSGRRDGQAAIALGEPEARLPAKAGERIHFYNEAAALEWLREFAEVRLRRESPTLDAEALSKACAALSADAILQFLDDRALWGPSPDPKETWLRMLSLIPLHNALLDRLGMLDLPRGLRAFPGSAAALLRSAARRDGALALHEWLAFREDCRSNPELAIVSGLETANPLASLFPSEAPSEAPQASNTETWELAALMEGWGSSDPEAAWATLADHPAWMRQDAVHGLIAGLQNGSNWQRWSQRLDAIDWEQSWKASAQPVGDPFLTLAGHWIQDDPDLAVAWYRGSQEQGAVDSESPLVVSQLQRTPDGEASLLSGWIAVEETKALQWLETDKASDELLARIVAIGRLDEAPKTQILQMIEDPAIRNQAATKASSDFNSWIWTSD